MISIAIVFAGGVGSRMGEDIPKQFLEWGGKPILVHTLEVFQKCPLIDEIILACKSDWIQYARELIEKNNINKTVSIVEGGDTALDSQFNALIEADKLHPDDNPIVLIHDGVRPLITDKTIADCIDCVERNGNAITVSKAIETVITIDDNEQITNIIDRTHCRMAKAPQCFYLHNILGLHKKSIKDKKHNYIDSASMMMAYNEKLFTIMGEPENIKITTPSDYYMFTGISRANTLSEKKDEE